MLNTLRLSFLLFTLTFLLASCERDDEMLQQPDFTIKPSLNFKIESTYDNGWIKSAQYQNIDGSPTEVFEYYENGFIKSAQVYASYPQQHLYMEVSRSEDNLPLESTYYRPDGSVWFTTAYEAGLLRQKTVVDTSGTTVYAYQNGELVSTTFTNAATNSISTTTYDRATDTRHFTVVAGETTLFDQEYPYHETMGAGIDTQTQAPLGNPFGAVESFYLPLYQSFSKSLSWQHDADPISMMLPYRLFDTFYNPGNYFATQFTVATDLYQAVIEQYPVTENGVMMAGGKYEAGIDRLENSFAIRDSLSKVRQADPERYKQKYGDAYLHKVGYGKYFFIIGAVRNLPTDENTQQMIKEAARKKINSLTQEGVELTSEEQKLLAKVWFELKFFSTLKAHTHGIVINSLQDYEHALQEINEADDAVIQLQYKSVDNL
ncbi:hypothetical protein DSM03_10118 [Leeuwenhoekiella aestuarii]|uniref:hypothetical protein n=1 Tax=Leeuwenhoekiella aestuarii TaxID=2249426 RepID=UPI000FFE85FE|nr:hypothetical protein [Leeuwenhoekiella aestuarii]RXG18655.1 hypothetical protein DSM03_10118 [Leeuwenhoekiella aestuarii]